MAKKKDQKRLEEIEDVRTVMATESGFRFVKRLIGVHGPMAICFNTDHATHSFLDGRRSVGKDVVDILIEACPDKYVRLLMELKSNQQEVTNVHKTDGSDEETAD